MSIQICYICRNEDHHHLPYLPTFETATCFYCSRQVLLCDECKVGSEMWNRIKLENDVWDQDIKLRFLESPNSRLKRFLLWHTSLEDCCDQCIVIMEEFKFCDRCSSYKRCHPLQCSDCGISSNVCDDCDKRLLSPSSRESEESSHSSGESFHSSEESRCSSTGCFVCNPIKKE